MYEHRMLFPYELPNSSANAEGVSASARFVAATATCGIDIMTGARTIMTRARTQTSWRPLLRFLTADRSRTGAALATAMTAMRHPDICHPVSPAETSQIEKLAERAVAEAYGETAAFDGDDDRPISDSRTRAGGLDSSTVNDVSKPADVLEVLGSTDPVPPSLPPRTLPDEPATHGDEGGAGDETSAR